MLSKCYLLASYWELRLYHKGLLAASPTDVSTPLVLCVFVSDTGGLSVVTITYFFTALAFLVDVRFSLFIEKNYYAFFIALSTMDLIFNAPLGSLFLLISRLAGQGPPDEKDQARCKTQGIYFKYTWLTNSPQTPPRRVPISTRFVLFISSTHCLLSRGMHLPAAGRSGISDEV